MTRWTAPAQAPISAASGRSLTGACASTPRTRKRFAASMASCPPALWPASATRSRSISRGQGLGGGHNVLERRRPVAAAVEPAVLDVPDRQAARDEIGRHAMLQVAPVALAPAAAVHEHDSRMRPVALGQPQLGHLLGVGAVADRRVRARRPSSARQHVAQRRGGAPAVVVAGVERHRREPDHIGLADIADHAVLGPQPRRERARIGHRERELAAAASLGRGA